MPTALKPGDTVERYRIESILGEGGTARVYRVRHTTLDTVHALKVLTLDHPNIRNRLIAEGKAQATLVHNNIVAVRDVLDHNGAPALLMDFVPGPSLAQHLTDALPHPDEVLRLFTRVVEGVAYAHKRGLIHRDLKPANVLIDCSQNPTVPRVTDFGLVRFLRPAPGEERRTAVGVMMGTLGYMAPEQLRDAHSADRRTDVFALGALLYSMLTGRPPFTGNDQLAIMNATAEGRYPSLEQRLGPGFDSNLSTVVDRCLQVDPESRYSDADALLSALEPVKPVSDPNHTMTWGIDEPVTPPVPTADLPSSPTMVLGQRSSQVSALIVDATGRGHRVEVGVVIDEEGTGVLHPPNVGRDAEVSAQLSTAVALGSSADECGIRWDVRGFTAELHGTSLGLPLAIALWCAANDRTPPAAVAFTGGVDLDGRVAPVSGVPAKLRAAASEGCHTVFVPADGLGNLELPEGLTVLPARSFDGVLTRLFPDRQSTQKRGPNLRFAALLVPLLMALTGLTARIEPLAHDPLLRWIHGPLPADNTAVVAFEPQRDARALRPQHPGVIDALVAAGAKSIFFDVILLAETPNDTAIAEAIVRARNAGVPVILPLMTENREVLYPESADLRDAAWFGAVVAQTDTTFWQVRRAPMRIRSLDGSVHWHAAAQTARGHLGADAEPRIEQGDLVIGPTRNPVWADLVYLHPAEPSPIISYSNPEGFDQVKGRSVLIGEMGGADDVHRTAAGTVYGVEIEAALIETLLQQRAPRLASPEINAALALLVGLFTALLGLALPKSRRGLAWGVPVAGVAIGIILVVAGVLVAFGPMVASSAIGLWIARTTFIETKPKSHP